MEVIRTLGEIQWGTVPQWLGALGAWLAAVGTVGSLAVAIGLLAIEIRERRKREHREDLAPASGIFAWAEPRTDAGGWSTWAANTSEEPVYDAVVYFSPLSDEPAEQSEYVLGTLPPDSRREAGSYPDRPSDRFGIPEVEIEFTDGRGRHWRRDGKGQLIRLEARRPFC